MIPSKIVCIGWNYKSHVSELKSNYPETPTIFFKPISCLIGNGDDVIIPEGVTNVQHEVELALIYGRTCKNVPENVAMDYISHVAVFNDVSARDMQWKARDEGNTWDLSKGIDTFGPMSEPIPKSEAGDLQNLDLEMRVNGEIRQKGNTKDMIFTIPWLISYVSKYITMNEGDVLITGTPEGVSEIRPGDVMEARIQNVGVLRNGVRAESNL